MYCLQSGKALSVGLPVGLSALGLSLQSVHNILNGIQYVCALQPAHHKQHSDQQVCGSHHCQYKDCTLALWLFLKSVRRESTGKVRPDVVGSNWLSSLLELILHRPLPAVTLDRRHAPGCNSFIHSFPVTCPALHSRPVPHRAVQRGWHLLCLRTHMLPHGGRPAVLVLLLLACLLACCARGARTGRSGIFVGYSEERVPKDWQGRAPQCTDSNGKQVCEAYKKANLCSTGLRPRTLQLDEPDWHRIASVHALCCAYLAALTAGYVRESCRRTCGDCR